VTDTKWDAFISHASEDKDNFVRPLASALRELGANTWYDEFSLKLGDSLSGSIDRGLAESRYGIVVISASFMNKRWPEAELRALVTSSVQGHIAILPIWHGVDHHAVSRFSPLLADKVAIKTDTANAVDIARQILSVIRPELYARTDRERVANSSAVRALQVDVDEIRRRLYSGERVVISDPGSSEMLEIVPYDDDESLVGEGGSFRVTGDWLGGS
jgi:hypothetical protein